MIENLNYIPVDVNGKELRNIHERPLPLYVNDGNIHNYPASHIPVHWHTSLEIFCQIGGETKIQAGEETLHLKAGDSLFINSEVLHSFTAESDEPCLYHSVVFSPEVVGGIPGSIFDVRYMRPLIGSSVHSFYFPESEGRVIFSEMDRLFDACRDEYEGYELRARNAVSEMIFSLWGKCSSVMEPGQKDAHDERIKRMLTFIDGNLENDIHLSDIAASASVSGRECQRLFTHYLHQTPMEYLITKRLLKSADLLIHTDEPVTCIARNCGFDSPGYYTKRFHNMTGVSPRTYRARMSKKHNGI